jgi:hypothetical protein
MICGWDKTVRDTLFFAWCWCIHSDPRVQQYFMSIPTALVSKAIYSLLAREAHLRMVSLTKATDGTSQMLKPRNWEGEVFMPLVTVMLSLVTHVIYIMSRKTDGTSLVGVLLHVCSNNKYSSLIYRQL